MATTTDIAERVETLRIRNQHASEVAFNLEPWGEVYALPSGDAYGVVAEGPRGDALEVELVGDRIVVYGWSGSTVRLFQDGVELGAAGSGRSRVPPLPGAR